MEHRERRDRHQQVLSKREGTFRKGCFSRRVRGSRQLDALANAPRPLGDEDKTSPDCYLPRLREHLQIVEVVCAAAPADQVFGPDGHPAPIQLITDDIEKRPG